MTILIWILIGVFSLSSAPQINAIFFESEPRCCLAAQLEAPAIPKACGEDGWRWSNARPPPEVEFKLDWRLSAVMFISLFLYGSSFPAVLRMKRLEWYFEYIMFLAMFGAGMLHHVSDWARCSMLGMTPLHWMKLSNTFALFATVGILLRYAMVSLQAHGQITREGALCMEFLQGALVSLTLLLQEAFFWRSMAIFVPIAGATVLGKLWAVAFSAQRSGRLQKLRHLGLVALLGVVCIGAFILITERDRDWSNRMNLQLGLSFLQANKTAKEIRGVSDLGDLPRIWHGSWPLILIACLNALGLFDLARPMAQPADEAKARPTFGIIVAILLLTFFLNIPRTGSLTPTPRREARWCCMIPRGSPALEEFNLKPSVPNGCTMHGWRRNEGKVPGPIDWADPRVVPMIWTTVVTNLSGLPPSLYQWHKRNAFGTVVGLSTMLYSGMYHLADSVDSSVLSLTPGNWHRLDNIYAIMAFVTILLGMIEPVLSAKRREFIKWLLMVVTIVLQELAPWNVLCTLLPILLTFIVVCVHLYRDERLRRGLKNHLLATGLVFFAIASLCFSKGLDEEQDHLRVWHGMWHLCSGTGVFFFSRGTSKAVDTYLARKTA